MISRIFFILIDFSPFSLFHRIFLEAPFLTSGSLKILRKACLDKVYGAFAITTLRELILTRARQRQELLRLLIEFSYFERADIREHVRNF